MMRRRERREILGCEDLENGSGTEYADVRIWEELDSFFDLCYYEAEK